MLPCVDLLTEHSEALRLHLQVNQTSVVKRRKKQKRRRKISQTINQYERFAQVKKVKDNKKKFKKSLNKNRDNFYIAKKYHFFDI